MRAVYNGRMEKGVNNMIEAIEGFRLPRYAQIPDVGLYLEQVVRYVNTHLAPLGEPELTSSMVSNYVKQGLISSPIKKSYTAEHLARLLFIAVVKPVVPLEGLRMMFSMSACCTAPRHCFSVCRCPAALHISSTVRSQRPMKPPSICRGQPSASPY